MLGTSGPVTESAMFITPDVHSLLKAESQERQIALEYLADAWNSAEADGVEADSLAHAALFAALATLVSQYGEEVAAKLMDEVPQRIRHGEYSVDRSIQ